VPVQRRVRLAVGRPYLGALHPLCTMTTRIVQLSDFHLVADPRERVKGVHPMACLVEVLQLVERWAPNADYLVLTGDLANDEAKQTYVALRKLLGDRVDRVRIIPGNHDDREAIREIFPESAPAEGPLTFSLRAGQWRAIGLDSQAPGHVHGRLSDLQLRWLARQLEACRPDPTILFIHHHLTDVGSAWLEPIGLENSGALAEVLAKASHVHALFHGHIHQEYAGQGPGVRVFGVPSTSFQFRPRRPQPEIDPAPPGFRIIELDGPSLHTHVVRLPDHEIPAFTNPPV
jgi:Icc protein